MATAMAATAAERAVLVRRAGGAGRGGGRRARALTAGLSWQEEEFRWLLHDEVHAVLRQLQDILKVRLLPRPPRLPSERLLWTRGTLCRPGPAPVDLASSRGTTT